MQRDATGEEGLDGYLPWPVVLTLAAEPADRLRHRAVRCEYLGTLGVDAPARASKDERAHTVVPLGNESDAFDAGERNFSHHAILPAEPPGEFLSQPDTEHVA
ncbi:MAG: hypothetical protein L0K86_06185 [Actinomycetia bacterium]|nr:hypothetical protein [Actinomycetes bacterium]